mmetsp:Transcript_40286/g.35548  ORF Transcript_40286/g.35548 Transcript_40286/m.35548 type:complete len:317 (-) Transcript_40286:43-993(-)
MATEQMEQQFQSLDIEQASSADRTNTTKSEKDALSDDTKFNYRKYATAEDVEIKKLIIYFIIAYAFTWTIWWGLGLILYFYPSLSMWSLFAPGLMGAAGPLVASCYLTYKYEGGRPALKAFLKRGIQFKTIPFWIYYSIFLVYILPLFVAGFFVEGTEIDYFGLAIFLPMFLVMYVGGPVQEEYGWRGYALDRMQLKMNSLTASIILGIIWGFWHLPLFYIEKDPHSNMNLWIFVLENVGSSIIINWLYNQSGSNITVAILCHMANNSAGGIFNLDDEHTNTQFITCMVEVAVGLLIITPLFGYKKFISNRCEGQK